MGYRPSAEPPILLVGMFLLLFLLTGLSLVSGGSLW